MARFTAVAVRGLVSEVGTPRRVARWAQAGFGVMDLRTAAEAVTRFFAQGLTELGDKLGATGGELVDTVADSARRLRKAQLTQSWKPRWLNVGNECDLNPSIGISAPWGVSFSVSPTCDGDGVIRYAHRAIAGLTFRPVDELVHLVELGVDHPPIRVRIAEKAFWPAKIPFPVLHVDTGLNFPEVLEFRDRRVAELGIQLLVASVPDAIDRGSRRPDRDAQEYVPERTRGVPVVHGPRRAGRARRALESRALSNFDPR